MEESFSNILIELWAPSYEEETWAKSQQKQRES